MCIELVVDRKTSAGILVRQWLHFGRVALTVIFFRLLARFEDAASVVVGPGVVICD